MSAVSEREISLIRDEDVLKKMWHETEDFGKKKEIRAHMYKLREARLKDLYCNSDVQMSSNVKTSFNQSTHADSLADHSFASLKSKEIRDSESPTRDVSYRITKGSANNQGWNVSKVDERSEDGKTHRIIQSAQTSGTEVIPKGKLDFEAKHKQEITSFQDGDDKNFIRSQGTTSDTLVRQEAEGGDEHSSFRTSSTKSSSSSRTVSEQKASYGDTIDHSVSRKQLPSSQDNVIEKSTKVYTTDAPKELKSHPGYVEGQTKITRETRTLADGTVVTTTKYETTGANEVKSVSSNQQNSSISTRQENRSKNISTSHDDKYSSHQTFEDSTQESKPKSRYYVEKTHTIPSNSDNVYQNIQSNISSNVQEQTFKNMEKSKDFKTTSNQNVDEKYEIRVTGDFINDKTDKRNIKNIERTSTRQTEYKDSINRENTNTNQIQQSERDTVHTERLQQRNIKTRDENSVPLGAPIEIEIDVSRMNRIGDDKMNKKTISTDETFETQRKKVPHQQENIIYDIPQRRESIQPVESEWKCAYKPTDHQYETTYNTDYTNKRISVDVSATHDAFARSLRAVSPDRINSRTNSRNLKNSNSSLRSSSSPEKPVGDHRQQSRMSPARQTRRHDSPTKKTPDRFSSTETITYKSSRSGSERKTPEKFQKIKHDESHVKTNRSDTITRKQKDDNTNVSITINTTRRSPSKGSPYTATPNDVKYNEKVGEIITDLDDDQTSVSHTMFTKYEKTVPSSLEYQVTSTRENHERTQTSSVSDVNKKSPARDTPKKNLPADRPLKRTDTYEERCRQILGITTETNERRRSSLEKLKRRGSSSATQVEVITKDSKSTPKTRCSPSRKTPDSLDLSPKPKSPTKQSSPLQEFPSQIRKSPEKNQSSERRYPEPTKPLEKRTTTEGKPLQEFPSQIRRTPEKPQHKSPLRDSPEKPRGKSPDNRLPHSGHISLDDMRTTNISSNVIECNKLVKQSSTDNLSRPKTRNVPSSRTQEEYPSDSRPFPERDIPGKTSPAHTKPREHIYEEISETRINVSCINKNQQRPPKENLPITIPSSKAAPTVNEKFTPERARPEKIGPNSPGITEESITQEVTYDVPKIQPTPKTTLPETCPDISRTIKSKETVEDADDTVVDRQTISTEVNLQKGYHGKISDQKVYSGSSIKTPDDNQTGNDRKPKLPEEPAYDVPGRKPLPKISTSSTTSEVNHKQIKLQSEKFPDASFPKDSDTYEPMQCNNEPLPSHKKPLKQNENLPVNKTSQSQENIRDKSRKASSKENISTSKTQVMEETVQYKGDSPDERPQQKLYFDQKPSSDKSAPSKVDDTEQNMEITATDITYINGHILDHELEISRKHQGRAVLKNRPEDEESISDTTVIQKEHRFNASHKNKQITQDEKTHISNKEIKRNEFSVGAPKSRVPEKKTGPIKSITTNKDIVISHNMQSKNIPDNVHPTRKTPRDYSSPVQKTNEKKKPKKELGKPSVDSENTSDEEIEEYHKKEYVQETYEEKTPVEEPFVNKKTVSLLYSDDEDDKKKTQLLIESEITDHQTIIDQKRTKPDKTTKTTTTKFIVDEKKEGNVGTIKSPSKTPTSKMTPGKKPLIEKNQNKPKANIEIEHLDKYNSKVVHLKNDNRQNTLSDIENFDNIREDNKVHIRTHRVDNTIDKRKFTSKIETDQRANKILQKKPNIPKVSNAKPSIYNQGMKGTTIEKPKMRTCEPQKPISKSTATKPSVSQKRVVPGTNSPKPKPDSKTTRTVNSSTKVETTRITKSKPIQEKIVKTVESDEESIPDSLNESIIESISDINTEDHETKKKISEITLNANSESPDRRTPSRSRSKPELLDDKTKTPKPKLEKRCISTKSIIINNTDKGITVNLQRSMSSREPTPDRICPLPVTSEDDDAAPRYPDKVVEPDDGAIRRNHKRLFDTAIQENEEGKVVHKIVEINNDINQKVTEVDKVDRDDDSLLTVNKKINKFLTTAEKLTEKSIVDISQPARKVERPKFEVDENLKEDECLLSVSDKVNKFISEAEHLTTQTHTQHRKSVNIDIKSDVSKKVNQFTNTHGPKTDSTSPKKSPTNEPLSLSKLDRSVLAQDVLITTECSQIEKEQDLFRTSKRPSKSSLYPAEESESTSRTPYSDQEFKSYQRHPTSPEQDSKLPSKPSSYPTKGPGLTDDKLADRSFPDRDTKQHSKQSKSPERDQQLPLKPATRRNEPEFSSQPLSRTPYHEKDQQNLVEIDSKLSSKPSGKVSDHITPSYNRSPSPGKNFRPYSGQPEFSESNSPKGHSPVRKYVPETTPTTRKDSKNYVDTHTEILSETPCKKVITKTDSVKDFTPKNRRPSQEEKIILSSVGRLRSSESIKKAKAVFENTETQKREERRQKDILNRSSVFEGRNKNETSSAKKIIDRSNVTPKRLDFHADDKCITRESSRTKITLGKVSRTQSPEKYVPDNIKSTSVKYPKERSSPDKENLTNGRSSRPHSPVKYIPDNVISTPSTRSKGRISPVRDIPGYMKPLDRSVRPLSPEREHSVSPEPYTHHESNESSVPEEDLPGYMKPLDRSSRPHSPKRHSPSNTKLNEIVGTPTKFGVTLKRTDSSKGITHTTVASTKTKKHPILSKKNITEEDIEQVYELDVLEELLLKLTSYELRRKIRTQIRIVKKLISENKLEITIQNIRNKYTTEHNSLDRTTKVTENIDSHEEYKRKTSPQRKPTDNKLYRPTDILDRTYEEKTSEYNSSYTRKESVSSVTRKESVSSVTRSGSPGSRASKSPERKPSDRHSPSRLRTESNITQEKIQTTHKKSNRNSPEESLSKTTTSNIFKSSLKKTEPKTRPPVPNGQPDWVSQRNLKKVNPNEVVRKTAVSSSSSSSVKKQTVRSASPVKEVKSTDIITSSYGVGPTDENGAPLFGLRALRAQNKAGNTKVQGTVVSSHYYSETGKEPVGQISVTKYSSDPRDLGSNDDLTQDEGVMSITTTQKFGFDDAPSLGQLTNTDKEICDVQRDKRTNTSKSSTITRRNSVKALTQKFVENAVEVSKNERQSSYPKAGLILRSSSFKNDSAVESSEDYSEISGEQRIQESVSMTTSNTRVVSGGTFLKNKSRVTGVQDAISRMKAQDVQDGDTEEDVEARGLLNKYLGSQVILSGIEGHVSKTSTATARSTSCSTSSKSTTKVTTVITENGKEVTKTRIFEHPISVEVLDSVWDEQTLRYLLDQSTDYEERKRIRARLRLIMAEQEACTELVKQASQDQSSQSIDESIETSEKIVTEGPVTTTKVTTRVTTQQQQVTKKPISPFAKFRQLDKQNSLNTPPSTPRTPGGSPLFKFTDAALSQSASTIKDRLLYWCRMKTKEYENIQLDNFSSSWADGLAFCALIHHFLPEAFDYHSLTPKERRHNFTLAFRVADEKADIAPLLDVDDMVATRRPDWKCVFTYVQSIYRRFKDED